MFQWSPLDVSSSRGEGLVGPQANKYEEVLGDDHLDVTRVVCVQLVGYPLPCDLSHDAFDVI